MSVRSPAGNTFVFVACGPGKYIDQLHYSLRALRSVSRSRIVVVTDSGRNERPVDWDDVIDVSAPATLDHHQASISLKTGLYQFLPDGPRYCYLDSDVVALRPGVDDIFSHQSGPVTFAADHIKLSEFSPYTLHCGCLERHISDLAELERMLADMAERPLRRVSSSEPRSESEFGRAKFIFQRILAAIPLPRTEASPQPRESERENWQSDPALGDVPARYARWTRDPVTERWYSPKGHEVHTVYCNHLVKQIRQKFGISVSDSNWQHWNGGVFLFDSVAHDFLDAWHQKTLTIFSDSAWRTRDQGTLAATVWEFGLQNAAVLDKGFNLIVDYFRNGRIAITADGSQVSNDNFATSTTACLIHVLNHFGDKSWDIWDWVDRQVENHRAAARITNLSGRELSHVHVHSGPGAS